MSKETEELDPMTVNGRVDPKRKKFLTVALWENPPAEGQVFLWFQLALKERSGCE